MVIIQHRYGPAITWVIEAIDATEIDEALTLQVHEEVISFMPTERVSVSIFCVGLIDIVRR
jgi:hypothetical protein